MPRVTVLAVGSYNCLRMQASATFSVAIPQARASHGDEVPAVTFTLPHAEVEFIATRSSNHSQATETPAGKF